jgi:hypothetical protein
VRSSERAFNRGSSGLHRSAGNCSKTSSFQAVRSQRFRQPLRWPGNGCPGADSPCRPQAVN